MVPRRSRGSSQLFSGSFKAEFNKKKRPGEPACWVDNFVGDTTIFVTTVGYPTKKL